MAYASLTDLIDAFDEVEVLQLADRDDDRVADPDVIASVQGRTQSLIDGYLSGRYALPLDPPYPPVIVGIDCDLQRYFLSDNQASDRVMDGYNKSMDLLKAINAGKVLLSLPAPTAEDFAGTISVVAPDRIFTRDTMAGF